MKWDPYADGVKLPGLDDLMANAESQMFECNDPGWCLNCGDWTHDGCEPDAHNYPCPVCDERAVFAAAELVFYMVP